MPKKLKKRVKLGKLTEEVGGVHARHNIIIIKSAIGLLFSVCSCYLIVGIL